jgi:hypothetical protein
MAGGAQGPRLAAETQAARRALAHLLDAPRDAGHDDGVIGQGPIVMVVRPHDDRGSIIEIP